MKYIDFVNAERNRLKKEILAGDRTGKFSNGKELTLEVGRRAGAEWRKKTGKPPKSKSEKSRETHLRKVYVKVEGVKTRTFRKSNGKANKDPRKVCTLGMDKDGFCLSDPKYKGSATTSRECVKSQRKALRDADFNLTDAIANLSLKKTKKSKSTSASKKPKTRKPKSKSTSASKKPKTRKPKSKSTSASKKAKKTKKSPTDDAPRIKLYNKGYHASDATKNASVLGFNTAQKTKSRSTSHKHKHHNKGYHASDATKNASVLGFNTAQKTKSRSTSHKHKHHNKGYNASDATKNASLWGIFGGGDEKSKKSHSKKPKPKKRAEAYASSGSAASSSTEWHSESYKAKHKSKGKKKRAPGYAVLNTSALLSYA